MKIVITGHTTGLGKKLYDTFATPWNDVKGISRKTGYYLESDIDRIIEESKGCDLFINNCYVGNRQKVLLERLHDKVGMMIVMGSIAGDYDQLIKTEYSKNKLELANRCKELSLVPGNKLLHIKISMLEDAVSGDTLIKYDEIVDLVNFWIKNPRFTSIDYDFKLTPFTLEKVKEKFNASQEAIDSVIANMCNINRDKFND